MNGLKTVKEVCEETGLTKKLLYDYAESGVAKPVDYKGLGYESNGTYYHGHKLYDEETVIKLHQVALFRELGLKRSEIEKIMTAKDYDSNKTLDGISDLLMKKKQEIEEKIFVVEQLKSIGIKNKLLNLMGPSIINSVIKKAEIAESLNFLGKTKELEEKSKAISEQEIEEAFKEVQDLDENSSQEDLILFGQKVFEIYTKYYGIYGTFAMVSMLMVTEGEGELSTELKLSSKENEAVTLFFKKNSENFDNSLVHLITNHYDAIGKDFISPETEALVDDVKELFKNFIGANNDEEMKMFMEFVDVEPYTDKASCVNYVFNALKYWLSNMKYS